MSRKTGEDVVEKNEINRLYQIKFFPQNRVQHFSTGLKILLKIFLRKLNAPQTRMVKPFMHQFPKLATTVRFPSPAPENLRWRGPAPAICASAIREMRRLH